MNEQHLYPLTLVRAHFDKAATSYDSHAMLQREIADRLLEHLEGLKPEPMVVLDVGCGTGYCTRALKKFFPRASVSGLDVSPSMVAQAKRKRRWFARSPRYFVADAHATGLPDHSVDMLVSNLTIQWCDTDEVLKEFARVLRPGGLLLVSSFGPDTLVELRRAWQTVDSGEHVHTFIDMHDLGDAMVRNGFASPVLDVDRITQSYESVKSIFEELKGIGAQNLAYDRARGLMGKQRFQAFKNALENLAKTNGRMSVTYEAVYAHAWAGAQKQVSGEVPLPFPGRRARN